MVLLKNANNVLPLKTSNLKIALVGPLANNSLDPIGPWSCQGAEADTISVLQGIKNVAPNVEVKFAKGSNIHNTTDEDIQKAT